MEKRRQWSFRMSKSNTWSWRAVDADRTERCSSREFDTLAECIVDAKQQGYVVLTPVDERRRDDTKAALE